MRFVRAVLVLLALAVFPVHAQICAPFNDVPASDTFCSNIQWMFNRGVTLGCPAPVGQQWYCPADLVRRDQMAAFMNRLGNVTFQQGGNAFAATAVLGTTDNQPLDIRVNNSRVMRYEPDATRPNVIGGAPDNSVIAGAKGATIGGGYSNNVGNDSTIGGGHLNTANGRWSTVGGGERNGALGVGSTVSGGIDNAATGITSTVAGGNNNQASGEGGIVVGGFFNVASGSASFAAGRFARASGNDCVVFSLWGGSPGMGCNGSQFNIGSLHGLSVDYHSQRSDGGGTRFVYVGNNFPPFTITTWTNATLGDNGVWNSVSDVDKKEAFAEVDKRAILETLATLPIRSFRYKVETDDVRHIGPTGQDFKAAFGLGHDGRTIGTVDADGIALAAIQGLNAKLEAERAAKDAEIAALRAELAEIRALLQGKR